ALAGDASGEPQRDRQGAGDHPRAAAADEAARHTRAREAPEHQTRRTSTTVVMRLPRRRPSRKATPTTTTTAATPTAIAGILARSVVVSTSPRISRSLASVSSGVTIYALSGTPFKTSSPS